ncbi:MAG TPA: MAPEG family protein, partial [Casimicrobiaceae bacterium]|nr:MAPEG family protein [Casimicrobiaceae bacterium]
PHVTALYAGAIGVLLIVLAALVSRLRRARKVGLGDGGDRDLQRAIRVHGNAVEWALPGLALLLVAELNRAAPLLLHACGIAIVAGRVLHAFGLSRTGGVSFGRFVGSGLSWTAVGVLALWCLWAFVRTLLR